MQDIVDYIDKKKNELFFDAKAQILAQTFDYFRNNGIIILDINDYKIDNVRDIDTVSAITDDSIKKIKDMIAHYTPVRDFRNISVKIFAKRFNLNTIVIRYSPINLQIFISNNVNDIEFIRKNSTNEFADVGIVLSQLYHQVSLPEIYKFYEDPKRIENLKYKIELFENWFLDAGFRPRATEKSAGSHPRYEKKYDRNLLEKFRDRCIIIGTFAMDMYLKSGIDHSYLEMIYPGDIREITDELKADYKYQIRYSDAEFLNRNLLITRNGKPVGVIYEGKYFCYPYRELNGFKLGTYPVIMKYMTLRALKRPQLKNNMIKFQQSIYRNMHLFADPLCLGINISSYRRYYMVNWGNRPWSFSRTISSLEAEPHIP